MSKKEIISLCPNLLDFQNMLNNIESSYRHIYWYWLSQIFPDLKVADVKIAQHYSLTHTLG